MPPHRAIFDQISTQKNLPSLPHILLKLLQACNQDNGGLNKISEIIDKDPALSAKILKLVNSAYFGLSKPIEDIKQAVVLIGTSGVKNVAVCSCIYEAFPKSKGSGVFDLKRFWWHSLRCAFLAKKIAEEVKYSQPDEAFLSGLLHDIGKLVLWVNFGKTYEELLENTKGHPEALLEGETRLGATHCEVAAWLLDRWHLQSVLTDPVLYHHEPQCRVMGALPLVQIVYVANALCQDIDSYETRGSNTAKTILGLDGESLRSFMIQADTDASEIARSLDINIDTTQPSETETPKITEPTRDLKKREALIREVRNVSLLVGTLQGFLEANDQDGILHVLVQGLQVLFDVKKVLFFICDSDRNVLFGKAPQSDGGVGPCHALTVSLNMTDSLIVRTLKDRKALDSFNMSGSIPSVILDEQVMRFLGGEGLFCLPMVAQGESVGVMVIGLSRPELSHLTGEGNLLNIFAHNGALALRLEQLKRSQLQTIQKERLGASADIARKVVHEVNNPLGIIKNYLKILGLKLSEQQIAQDEIRIISEEIDRVATILKELSAFSAEKAHDRGPVDVNALLLDILKITRDSLTRDSKVELQLDLERSLPPVVAEKDGLKQVFINLIKNAAEAMKGGGNLHIQTRYVPGPFGVKPSPGDKNEHRGYAEITFSDDGPGISEEIRARLFEPFVSSKGGEHSGLGLSVAHNIIKSFNGHITCTNKAEAGTEFVIELPVSSSH